MSITIDVFVLASFLHKEAGFKGFETITVEESEMSEASESPISFVAMILTTT